MPPQVVMCSSIITVTTLFMTVFLLILGFCMLYEALEDHDHVYDNLFGSGVNRNDADRSEILQPRSSEC